MRERERKGEAEWKQRKAIRGQSSLHLSLFSSSLSRRSLFLFLFPPARESEGPDKTDLEDKNKNEPA